MATPSRPRKVEDGILYLICNGPFHDGAWITADRFYKYKTPQRGKIFKTYCRECESYIQAQRNGYTTRVKIGIIRKWLQEVVDRCGSFSAAARTMGVSYDSVLRWLGRVPGYEGKKIRPSSARLILETLAGLRDGSITPLIGAPGGRSFKHGCKGCGCLYYEETPGCKSCRDRKLRKASRLRNST